MNNSDKQSIAALNEQMEEIKAKLARIAKDEERLKPTMTVEELASFLNTSLSHVYEQLSEGQIPAHHLGRKWIISRQQIEAWFNNAPAIPITQREGYNK
jgi:excisionase family DNA binding protein